MAENGGSDAPGRFADVHSGHTGDGVHSPALLGLLPHHFRLIVVFTPWLVVLSSNQRAVTVLVCV